MENVIIFFKESIDLCISIGNISNEEIRNKENLLKEMYRKLSDNEILELWKLMEDNLEPKDEIWVLSVLGGFLPHDRLINRISLITEHFQYDDLRYNYMVEYQILTSDSINNYSRHYMLHKRNVELTKQMLPSGKFIPVSQRNKNNVIIVTDQLLDNRHSPSMVQKLIAYGIQKLLGLDVMFCILPLNYEMPYDIFFESYMENAYKTDNNFFKLSFMDEEFMCCQAELKDENVFDEYTDIVQIIDKVKPYFILSCCVNPIADFMNEIIDVATMNFSAKTPPVSTSNIFIRQDKYNSIPAAEELIRQNNVRNIFINKTFPVIISEDKIHYTRKEEGLPEKDILIAVVGNRLNVEITEDFIKFMENVLKSCKHLSFVFIGQYDNMDLLSSECFKDRIYFLGYRNYLYETYKMLDIYVNPKRNGGGWSAGLAISAGLPVLSHPDCDVAAFIEEKYLCTDYREMENKLYKIIENKSTLEQIKKDIKQNCDNNTEDKLKEYVGKIVSDICTILEEKKYDTI